jgi:hypothetical protein
VRAARKRTAGLLVDEAADALDAAAARQAADGGLRDALDVVAEHLAVALGAALAQALATLAASRHCEREVDGDERGERMAVDVPSAVRYVRHARGAGSPATLLGYLRPRH